MPGEGRPTQRGLVGRRIALRDVQLATKYAFPFVGADWAVPFIVLDVLGGRPQILASRAVLRGGEIRADAAEDDLRPIESLPVEGFARLAHFRSDDDLAVTANDLAEKSARAEWRFGFRWKPEEALPSNAGSRVERSLCNTC